MPNGGVPIHMILHPRDGDITICCKAGHLQVFSRDDYKRDRAEASQSGH